MTLTLTAVAALCAGCGGGTTAPATGSTPKPTPKASRNVERGEVVAVKGDVVTLTAPDGTDTSFNLSPTTTINQQQDALVSDATVGSCVFGLGERTAPDLVAARQVILTDHGPQGAGDCRKGSSGDIHHLGFAGGELTAIDGSTFTVNSNAGPQRFQVSPQTKVVRLVRVPLSTLAAGQCASARGPRDKAGVLTASSVVLSNAAIGGCFAGGSGLGGPDGPGGSAGG
jgi:hypothetical protein